jgi:hypothetical protein
MMKNTIRTIGLVTTVMLFACMNSIIPMIETAQAVSYTVTVKWIVPADYSLSISYPTGNSEIDFSPLGKNFTGLDADDQLSTVWAMNITNIGNAAVDISANFTAGAMATGITFFNLSTTFANEKMWFWVPANATTAQEISDNLAVGSHGGWWAWSSGVNVPAGTVSKTLYVASAAHT